MGKPDKKERKDKKEKKDKKDKKDKKSSKVVETEVTETIEQTEVVEKVEEVKAEVAEKVEEENDSYDFFQYHSNFQTKKDRAEELKEKENDSDDDEDPIKVIEPKIRKPKVEKPPKPETYGVWVGNLFFNITEDELKNFFKGCGTITRVKMPMVGNKNRGFAFIDFETPEERDKAIAMSESIFFKRPLLIKDSKDFNKKGRTKAPEDSKNSKTQQAAFLRSQSHDPSATLFIGNLPFECTADFLMEKFKIYGNVKKVRLATFEDTNRCKGFGYIDFEKIEDSTKALLALKDRFKVEFASIDATRRGKNLQPNQAKEYSKRRNMGDAQENNGESNESQSGFNNRAGDRPNKRFRDEPSKIGEDYKGSKITFDD